MRKGVYSLILSCSHECSLEQVCMPPQDVVRAAQWTEVHRAAVEQLVDPIEEIQRAQYWRKKDIEVLCNGAWVLCFEI